MYRAFAPFFMGVMGDRRVTAVVKAALYGTGFSREFNAIKCRLYDSCHPSVTPDAHEKGCKRPVHRRSGTLAPFNKKNLPVRLKEIPIEDY